MDVLILLASVIGLYNGWYWSVPLMGLVTLTLTWEQRLSQLERWKWKLSPVPKCVIQGCEYYNGISIIKFMNDNLNDVYDMFYDIMLSVWKTSNQESTKMSHLISRLDKMPYDIINEIPPEQMVMVKENSKIQQLIGTLDNMMVNNKVLRERLHQAKLDTRIKNLIQSLKRE